MLAYKRIIPCLDIKDGRVVKGVNFVDLKDAGDPVEIAAAYIAAGADELMFLDIAATSEDRTAKLDVVRNLATVTSFPFSVGGGLRSVDDVEAVLDAGATKVVIGSAAVLNPELVSAVTGKFGSERIIVAIDASLRSDESGHNVYINGGRNDSGIDAVTWAKEAEQLGVGEILLTSIGRDGTKAGYDLELTASVTNKVSIPVIASGGAGTREHFHEVLTQGRAAAALAASLFHFKEVTIGEVKEYLAAKGVPLKIR
ncbi:MAG: imidazole glycerol phosphate synthase subunit HisF [Lachnospiraceae bacterium]|jgi:cyclase|nr:imidazole glycerol phosphate synthase subunit HisF [Lachnospiraceae bacterium]